uniref:Uncharacterized protein n=1 Tax=Amphimedon queenslandica TaxID=400682 RepID=A0A1X7UTW4_AMPQE
MELSLLEAKTGSTNNNGQTTTGLAESVETRWIITDQQFGTGCMSSTLTEVLVGVDIRTETGNRTQYPKIEIWEETQNQYKNTHVIELRLSLDNFTTNGLYHVTLPTPLTFGGRAGGGNTQGYRLGVYQPPDDRSVVRFYKVNGTGQIGRIVDNGNNSMVNKNSQAQNQEITLQNSSILIHPITSNNCNCPPINESSFNTNSLSVTNVIPVNDTRAFPDIQFTCNGNITNWIIGITQNQDTSKHYPKIYLKRSSKLIHALTVDASAATSSNGNVHNFTSDIEVQYGDILVINVTTNSNPMYYQQYNGPLNYQLDSSNRLIPLEHNDYPLISVVVDPSPFIPGMSSTIITTDTIHTQSTCFLTPDTTTITSTTNVSIPSTTSLDSTSSSSLTSSPTLMTPTSINNTLHITSTHSQLSNTLSSTLSVTSPPTPSISDGTVSPPPPIVSTISSTSATDSSTSNPSVTLSTEGTLQSTGSNTLAAVLSTLFILLVVTILAILIVSVLVYKRRHQKLSSRGNSPMDTRSTETELNNMSNPTYQPQDMGPILYEEAKPVMNGIESVYSETMATNNHYEAATGVSPMPALYEEPIITMKEQHETICQVENETYNLLAETLYVPTAVC